MLWCHCTYEEHHMNGFDAIGDVQSEAARAMKLHPQTFYNHHEAKAVIEEEFDEYWELVKLNPKKPMIHPTKGHTMTVEQWKKELRAELTQVAAMCVRAMVELC